MNNLPDNYWVAHHDFELPEEWNARNVPYYCDYIKQTCKETLNIDPVFIKYNVEELPCNKIQYTYIRHPDVKVVRLYWFFFRQTEAVAFCMANNGFLTEKHWPGGLSDDDKHVCFIDIVVHGM